MITAPLPYPTTVSRWMRYGLLVGFALLWFIPLDIRHLVPSDEGRYAEIAREMFVSGDWITPRYNGYKYFEKPPLQSWMTALAYMGFGVGDWQARLWTALTGFATVLMVGFTASRIFHPTAGWFAAVVLASSPYWNLMGHFNALDMGLACMMTMTLCTLLLAQRPMLRPGLARGWMLACWASMALAVLSKGLIGVVLPGAILILYSVAARDGGVWRRLYPLSGLPVFLLIAAPWFIAVQLRNPEFFTFFFINEHFRRYVLPDHHRTGAPSYFVWVLLVGFLPWLSVTGQSLWHAARLPRQANGFSPIGLLAIWTLFIFLFFSFSKSKLVSYTLPVAPALALLIGLYLPTITRSMWRRHIVGYAIVLIVGSVGVLYLSSLGDARTPNALYRQYQWWVWAALATGLLGMLGAALVNQRRAAGTKVTASLGIFAASWFIAVGIAGNAHEIFGRASAGVALAPAIRAEMAQLPTDVPFYSVDVLDHTMPFYLDRTMIMVQHKDELAFGIGIEPQKWVPTLQEWQDRWRADHAALALMSPALYKELFAAGLPMRLIAQDERRVVVSRSATATSPQTD